MEGAKTQEALRAELIGKAFLPRRYEGNAIRVE